MCMSSTQFDHVTVIKKSILVEHVSAIPCNLKMERNRCYFADWAAFNIWNTCSLEIISGECRVKIADSNESSALVNHFMFLETAFLKLRSARLCVPFRRLRNSCLNPMPKEILWSWLCRIFIFLVVRGQAWQNRNIIMAFTHIVRTWAGTCANPVYFKRDQRLQKILQLAEPFGISVQAVIVLKNLLVCHFIKVYSTSSSDFKWKRSRSDLGSDALLLALDQVTDPHNLGSVPLLQWACKLWLCLVIVLNSNGS